MSGSQHWNGPPSSYESATSSSSAGPTPDLARASDDPVSQETRTTSPLAYPELPSTNHLQTPGWAYLSEDPVSLELAYPPLPATNHLQTPGWGRLSEDPVSQETAKQPPTNCLRVSEVIVSQVIRPTSPHAVPATEPPTNRLGVSEVVSQETRPTSPLTIPATQPPTDCPQPPSPLTTYFRRIDSLLAKASDGVQAALVAGVYAGISVGSYAFNQLLVTPEQAEPARTEQDNQRGRRYSGRPSNNRRRSPRRHSPPPVCRSIEEVRAWHQVHIDRADRMMCEMDEEWDNMPKCLLE